MNPIFSKIPQLINKRTLVFIVAIIVLMLVFSARSGGNSKDKSKLALLCGFEFQSMHIELLKIVNERLIQADPQLVSIVCNNFTQNKEYEIQPFVGSAQSGIMGTEATPQVIQWDSVGFQVNSETNTVFYSNPETGELIEL